MELHKIYKAPRGQPIRAAVESASNGFGGTLTVLVGFDNEGNIIDYSLLSHSETPGLGSKAADWFKKGAKGDITGKNPESSFDCQQRRWRCGCHYSFYHYLTCVSAGCEQCVCSLYESACRWSQWCFSAEKGAGEYEKADTTNVEPVK